VQQQKKNGAIKLQPAVKRQCVILALSLTITTKIAFTGFTIPCGIAGVVFYIWFICTSLQTNPFPEESKEHDEENGEIEEVQLEQSVKKGILYLVTGGFLIIVFSSPFINSVVEAAALLEVNPLLLAFFLAPIASEAPEILESISLSRKGNSQSINIAYSNLIGGTITKTTLLCGVFCFFGVFKGFAWESSYSLSLLLLAICAAAAAGIGTMFNQQFKWHGVALLLLFVLTGAIQFFTNSKFNDEIFPDEGFAHDDQHPVILDPITTAILGV